MDDSTPPFVYRLRVRFHECDGQRVVFNSRYGDFIDLAVGEFVRTLGSLHPGMEGSFDYQLVKQTIEWKRPARFDDVLDVAVTCLRVGTTSFTVSTILYRAGERDLLSEGETVYVLMDTVAMTKRPIPPAFRHALEQGAAGYRVNHSDCVPIRYSGHPAEPKF